MNRLSTERSPRSRLGMTAAVCAVFVAGMVGMSFAAVPLYSIFCQVTGFAGTTQRASDAPTDVLDRKITIRFDGNVANGLGWSFRPLERQVTLGIGEVGQVSFAAENRTNSKTTGTATFNVTPNAAGAYFNKLACFCFTEQVLEPGQSLDMPVQFFVDPEIVNDSDLDHVNTITLSYTFYPATNPRPPPVAAAGAEGEANSL